MYTSFTRYIYEVNIPVIAPYNLNESSTTFKTSSFRGNRRQSTCSTSLNAYKKNNNNNSCSNTFGRHQWIVWNGHFIAVLSKRQFAHTRVLNSLEIIEIWPRNWITSIREAQNLLIADTKKNHVRQKHKVTANWAYYFPHLITFQSPEIH